MWVGGSVQGVGFRWWVQRRAQNLGVVGSAENQWDGRVEIIAEGDDEAVAELVRLVTERPSTEGRPGHVREQEVRYETATGKLRRFDVA
jgi:acylphosphatase